MGMRFTAAAVAAIAVALAVAASAAALVGLYRNSMETEGARAQLVKVSGERCQRGGSSHALQITVGKSTQECAYRTPVIGRDLEIAADERLLSSTPKPLQRVAFVAVNLRIGDAGAGYQLAVFPMQRKVQLRKTLADGHLKYLHIQQGVSAVQGLDKPNELRLRAFNITSGSESGDARIVAFVGGEQVADVTDNATGELQGRESGVSVGATKSAQGLAASVDNVVVRAPSPF